MLCIDFYRKKLKVRGWQFLHQHKAGGFLAEKIMKNGKLKIK